jgi:FKBP-type peptidyl-prolyl cis-trans isomerase
MKSIFTVLLGASLVLGAGAADDSSLKTQKEKVSYVLGMNFGKQVKQNDVEIDITAYMNGLKDGSSGGKTLLTDEEAKDVMMAFQQDLQSKRMEKQKAEGEKNRKAGDAFLAENKKKEGVQVRPVKVGTNTYELQYKVETKGTGKIPSSNDTVVCHYRGTLIDGTEFDSSYKRSEPQSFGVTQVIRGWTEALLMMPVGSKWKLFIPSDLAYGERGRPSIPPNSTLLFDIELISIKEGEAAIPPAAVPGAPGSAAPKIQVVPAAKGK